MQSKVGGQMGARARDESESDQGWIRRCQDAAAPASSPLQTELWAPAVVYKSERFSSAPPEVCLNKGASSPSVRSPAMPVCQGSGPTVLYGCHVKERSDCHK